MLAVCKDLYRILRKKDAETYNVLYLQLVCEYKKEEIVVLKLKINEISNMYREARPHDKTNKMK